MWRRLLRLLGSEPPSEAEAALARAQTDLAAAVKQGPAVRREVAELQRHRDVNHLAERIKASLREA